MSWVAPYGPSDTKVLYEGSGRLTSVAFSADGKTMFVADSGAVFAMRTADPSKKCSLGTGVTLPGGGGFGGRGGGGGRGGAGAADDTTGGALATKSGPHGEPVVIVGSDNKTVFLSGTRTPGANWNTQGPRPWVDKLDFETGQRARVFDSPADAYDEFVTGARRRLRRVHLHARIADGDRRTRGCATRRAARARRSRTRSTSGRRSRGAQHKRIQVTRPRDGIKFWVDLTLPARLEARARDCPASSGSIRASTRRRPSTIARGTRRTSTSSPKCRRRGRRRRRRLWVTAGLRGDRTRLPDHGRFGQDERQLHARPARESRRGHRRDGRPGLRRSRAGWASAATATARSAR